jgi:hypothetical protein
MTQLILQNQISSETRLSLQRFIPDPNLKILNNGQTCWSSFTYFTISGEEKLLKNALLKQILEAYKSHKTATKETSREMVRAILFSYFQNPSFCFGFSTDDFEKVSAELEILKTQGLETTIGNYENGIAITLSSEYTDSLAQHIWTWANRFGLTVNSIKALPFLIHRNIGGTEVTTEKETMLITLTGNYDRKTLSNAGANLHQLLARFPNGSEVEFKQFQRPTRRGLEVRRVASMYFGNCIALVKVQALPDEIEGIIHQAPSKQMPLELYLNFKRQ